MKNRDNEQKFYNDMSSITERSQVYASETDISVVKHHLLKGGVALETVSAIDTKKCMYFGRMPVIWLFKQAFYDGTGKLVSGNHFGYFRKDDCSTLHDPCSGKPIEINHLSHRNPVKYLEEKIKVIAAAAAASAAGGAGGGGASAGGAGGATNLELAASFGLTLEEFMKQKKAWIGRTSAKPPGKPRKTRKNRR